MDFNKNSLFCFAFILTLKVSVDGLSEEKLKYWSRETNFLEDQHLPVVDEAILDQVLDTAKRSVERERINGKKLFSSRKVRDEIWDIAEQAEIGSRAADILSMVQNLTREASDRIVKRVPPRQGINFNVLCQNRNFNCNPNAKYRNFDGSCNNLANPDWGMAIVRQRRLLDPKYGDRVNSPRLSVNGRPLPLSRFVSTTTIPDISSEHEKVTHMFVQFGQFLNHDITSTPDRTDLTNCCNNRNTVDCLPLTIPRGDPQFERLQVGCMEFARSIRACGNGVREQINQNTVFIDGSQIYGNSGTEAAALRTMQGGLLQTSNNGVNLPVNPNDSSCATRGSGRDFCFRAGDARLNIQPGLLAVHTLFLREHNRIARILKSLLPQLSDETLFQETRRVVIAELQSIVYNEYLPIILGNQLMSLLDLVVPKDGRATAHNPEVNPGILNSFAAAAFRFGHSLIHNFGLIGTSGNRFALKDNFNNPTVIHRSGADAVLVGSVVQKAEGMENFMVEAVTRFLFKEGNNPAGLDLAAFNIERGREHGVPSYNDFREFCELSRIRSFDELRTVFSDSRAVGAFREAYENVDDIDLFPAGIAEIPVRGGIVGETFACIIGIQFFRLFHGDRHFFTNGNEPGSFTSEERAMLSKRTLASIMCDNLDVNSVQLNAFLNPGDSNRVISCNGQPKIDFRIFM